MNLHNNIIIIIIIIIITIIIINNNIMCQHSLHTIKTHVLSKWLSHQHAMSLSNKVPDRLGVPATISTGKSLVCHVKEREQLPFLKQWNESNNLFCYL